jgi:hypothetical protein
LVKDIISILGTIGALPLATIGLTTWRRQLRGTAEYEVAKKVLRLTYEVQDAIRAVRSPMLYLRQEEVEAGCSLQEEQRIYQERLNRLEAKWSELRPVILESRVIWGLEAEASFKALRERSATLHSEIWLHFWLKGAYAGPGATVDRNPERIAANDKAVYFISDEDDFSKEVKAAVDRIEGFFEKRVRRSRNRKP